MSHALQFHDLFDVDNHLQEEEFSNDSLDVLDENEKLNYWYQEAILNFDTSKEGLPKILSEKDLSYIRKHSVISAVSVVYHLLSKFTMLDDEQQINTVLKCLQYLAYKKVPKEYIGGFALLMVKYHHLP